MIGGLIAQSLSLNRVPGTVQQYEYIVLELLRQHRARFNLLAHKTTPDREAPMKLAIACAAAFLPLAASHSSLISPKPRNAIDSELPEWKVSL
eukprot:COSAG03_NODE_5367_length_1267_cov_1.216610_3_plen_93_part_00